MGNQVQEIIELIKEGQEKHLKLIGTHYCCPDGMLSALMFLRIKGNADDYQVIPLDYKYLSDPDLKPLLDETEFEAILDFGPVGKSIKYFGDHHHTNIQITQDFADAGKIEHNYFDSKAPSGCSVVDVMGNALFGKGVPKEVLEPANRGDTAQYSTEQPTNWEEFWDGDEAWQYSLLTRTTHDSPKAFVQLISELLDGDLKEVIDQEKYKQPIQEALETSARVKEIAQTIKKDTITIMITNNAELKPIVNRPLMFRIYDGSVKVAVTIHCGDEHYKISFGLELGMPEDEVEEYRADKIAEELGAALGNGGGHKVSSGAVIKKTEEQLNWAIEKIKERYAGKSVSINWIE